MAWKVIISIQCGECADILQQYVYKQQQQQQ